jgi:hypothetical protein
VEGPQFAIEVAKRPVARKRLANFNAEEDVKLSHCWLAISYDSIVNTRKNNKDSTIGSSRQNMPKRSTK